MKYRKKRKASIFSIASISVLTVILISAIVGFDDSFTTYYESKEYLRQFQLEVKKSRFDAEVVKKQVLSSSNVSRLDIVDQKDFKEIHLRGVGESPKEDRVFIPGEVIFEIYTQ